MIATSIGANPPRRPAFTAGACGFLYSSFIDAVREASHAGKDGI
jgi:hypothetical protein